VTRSNATGPVRFTSSAARLELLEKRQLLAAAAAAALPDHLFIENHGQWDGPVRFAAWDGQSSASFTPTGIRLANAASGRVAVDLTFEGASSRTKLIGESKQAGHFNFYVGDDASRWRSDVPAYAGVRYDDLYAGLDVRVRQQGGHLEYDLLLEPNADLHRVVLRVDGATGLTIGNDGALRVKTAAGVLRQSRPVTWEVLPDGSRRAIDAKFKIIDATHFGFEAPGWDGARPLVIDPGLEWSTFVGGSQGESVAEVAAVRDGTGDVVIAGTTNSPDFPGTGTLANDQRTMGYVARLNASGSRLVYATLFGNAVDPTDADHGSDRVEDMALDASGAPVVVGTTEAADFPTTANAFQKSLKGFSDAFVTRFDAAGKMTFSTYLGGTRYTDPNSPFFDLAASDEARAVGVDSAGSVVVAGMTQSPDFPTTAGAYDRSHNAAVVDGSDKLDDMFITRLNPTLSALTYSTFLGGEADEEANDLVAGPTGIVTVAGDADPGQTIDDNDNYVPLGKPFPTTADAVQRKHQGSTDAVLARLRMNGQGASDLLYSTILGGREEDFGNAVAADPGDPNRVTLAGETYAWNFPTTPGALRRTPIDPDSRDMAFASQFQLPGAAGGAGALRWSTLLGGTSYQFATDVAIDPSGDVIVVGGASPEGSFPTTSGSFQPFGRIGNNAQRDAFVSRISADGKRLVYSTFLGGANSEGNARVDSAGPDAVFVAGDTSSTDFPTTPGTHDRQLNGGDVFVSKLTLLPLDPSDNTGPAAPTPVTPADSSPHDDIGPIRFDWTDVVHPAGIRGYQFQISPNADFARDDDNNNQWTDEFTTASQIDRHGNMGNNWWRVRAIDNANNFGAWSTARRFVVGDPAGGDVLSAVVLQPDAATAGGKIQGVIVLHNPAPAGGVKFTVKSSNPNAAKVPTTVTVPAGATRATFDITAGSVTASTPVRLTVETADPDNSEQRRPVLWIDPAITPPGAATLKSLALGPNTVAGGKTTKATITLTAPAGPGGVVVQLTSEKPNLATVPTTITIPAGQRSATFTVNTKATPRTQWLKISATIAGVTRRTVLTVTPVKKDVVTVKRAEYTPAKRELRIEATSTNPATTIHAYDGGTGKFIGTLTREGGGKFTARFTWPTQPKNLVLRSDDGGTAAANVLRK
jgi:hypothetical protein